MVTRATPTSRSRRTVPAKSVRARATKKAAPKKSVAPSKKARSRSPVSSRTLRGDQGLGRPTALPRGTRTRESAADNSDGRRLRAARNYEAVVTAVLDIARECPPQEIYLPSAAEVAARAGVSERTVFRHFADLNALFVAAASRIRPIQEMYVGPRPDFPKVADRIEEIVRLRSRLYEEIAPIRRVAIHLSHTHPLLVEQLGQAFAAARAQVADVFAPELSRLDARRRTIMLDALDVAAGWASWDMMRTVQNNSVARARTVMTQMLTDLLATVPRARRG